MAQYLPYIPQVLPDPVIYNPDFNFFDRMLQRKQSMFDQGLSQVKSAYSSVLNAPLSDKANLPLRDEYLKSAQEQLKKISSTDLSLPQNVQAAQGIYAPFWEDEFISKDAALTKWYQNEAAKVASWRDSADPKVRSQYNDISMMYLNNGLSALQNANRNPEAYGKVEKRQAVPFTNIEAYLQEQAKGQRLEIKYDDPTGPYLVQTTNGQRSQKKYSVWAQSMVGNNFYGQFRVTGIVEKEERAKAIKRANPNLSEQEIGQMIAKDAVNELSQGYKRRQNEVEVELARVNSLIGSVAKANNPANQPLFDSLLSERANLMARKEAIGVEYDQFDKESKDRLYNIVLGNPDSYFATLAKQRLVDNWATGRASIEKKEIKENAAWTAAEGLKMRRMEYDLNAQKAVWDRDQDLWERVNPKPGTTTDGKKTTTTGLKDKDGNPIEPLSEQAAENALTFRGPSGIDITKDPATAYDRFSLRQNQTFGEAHSLIFDQKGILGLATNLGLNQAEISYVAAALRKDMADNSYKYSKEESAAASKLNTALLANQGVKNAGIGKITGPGTLRNALIAYAQDYFQQRNTLAKDGADIALTKDESEALIRYLTAVEKLNNFNANEERRNELIKKNILTNDEYKSLVVDRNGTKDLITISDLARDMKPLTLSYRDSTFGPTKEITVSKEELAKAYMSGNMTGMINSRAYGNHIRLNDDGRHYSVRAVGDKKIEPGLNWQDTWDEWWDPLVKKYGKPTDMAALMKKANETIVPDLLIYKGQSGKQGTSWRLTPLESKSGQNDIAWAVVDEALNTNNGDIVLFDDGTNKVTPIDAEKAKAIRVLLSKEQNVEKFTSIEYIPQGVGGKRTVRLNFVDPISDEDKKIVANSGLTDIFSLGTVNVVLKDDVQTPAISSLPNNTGYQVFDVLSRGRVLKSDPVIAASGFNFTITPNVVTSDGSADETPSYVTVELEYNARVNQKDPATGQLMSTIKPQITSKRIDLVGPNAKSPDEIVNYLYGLYLENMRMNQAKAEEFQNHMRTAPTASQQRADFNEQLRQLGLENLIPRN